MNTNEYLVIHTKDEIDGQTVTVKDYNNKIYTTVISIANGNWVDLKVGDIISLEIEDIIKINPVHLISKNIKVISKKHLKERIVSSISMMKDSYNLGESLELQMKVENLGKEKSTFLPWKTPIENSFTGEFMEITFDNKKIEYSGIVVKRMPPTEEDYITLKPNESVTGKINLLDGYKFTKKGVYSIQFDGNNDKLPSSNVILIEIK
ncbi:hypothetical protein LCL86_13255 [Muricauda ruestringensis]|uniref:hypothetical protein n=1 Tax=Flagellimonas TaxID=444459 RepID=UPI001CD621F3|nr:MULTISPECIES: hypothetical protein [Allomuricauda]MCA0960020.1 hypothetical protein [Allomuricauda ruestringensis]USD24953.1 hypothetical protein MJO53_14850 [Allomuricauda aquimarina]